MIDGRRRRQKTRFIEVGEIIMTYAATASMRNYIHAVSSCSKFLYAPTKRNDGNQVVDNFLNHPLKLSL